VLKCFLRTWDGGHWDPVFFFWPKFALKEKEYFVTNSLSKGNNARKELARNLMKCENLGIHPLLHLKKTPHSSNTLIFRPYLQQEGQQIFFGERGNFATFGHTL
jgi:hypothetical protein